jgi:hypothetical protein
MVIETGNVLVVASEWMTCAQLLAARNPVSTERIADRKLKFVLLIMA